MAGRRLSMRKIKEVLRLHWDQGLSDRQIATSCGIARSSVKEFLVRAQRAGLSWPLQEDLDDGALEARLFPPAIPVSPKGRPAPRLAGDPPANSASPKSHPAVVMVRVQRTVIPEGYQYSQFCELYRRWAKKLDFCLRQEHRAGEKVFVDFAPEIPDYPSGDRRDYPESLVRSRLGGQQLHLRRSLSFGRPAQLDQGPCPGLGLLGCLPQVIVPDNTKTGVTKPCRYDPELNPTYQEMARYMGWRLSRPGFVNPKIKPRSKRASYSLNAGSWPPYATRPSFPWPRPTRPSGSF